MIRVPGGSPQVPAPIPPKEAKPKEEVQQEQPVSRPVPPPKEGAKGPELDARAIAVRMAALAAEAKEKELSFDEILQKVIAETGMTNPESALEEASRKLQKDIEEEIDKIKSNKELMDEADAWQAFGQLLEEELNNEQIEGFLGMIKESIKGI